MMAFFHCAVPILACFILGVKSKLIFHKSHNHTNVCIQHMAIYLKKNQWKWEVYYHTVDVQQQASHHSHLFLKLEVSDD